MENNQLSSTEAKLSEQIWITDKNNNRASIEYFGDEATAKAALETLQRCSNCVNCVDCHNCHHCLRCRHCRNCVSCTSCYSCHSSHDCTKCEYVDYSRSCEDCNRCKDCRSCSDCVDCVECTRNAHCRLNIMCSDCHYCQSCSRCGYCHDCVSCDQSRHCQDCNICEFCNSCHKCIDCKYCAHCTFCRDLKHGQMRHVDPEKNPAFKVPVIKNIHTAIFEAAKEPNALNMASVHSCDTTHCRAGWVVHLAGDAGYALEARTSWMFAAMQIYKESGSPISPNKFHETDDEALADMKTLAEWEAQTKQEAIV